MSELQTFAWLAIMVLTAVVSFTFGVFYETDKRNERLIKEVFNGKKKTTNKKEEPTGRDPNSTAYDELDQWAENGHH